MGHTKKKILKKNVKGMSAAQVVLGWVWEHAFPGIVCKNWSKPVQSGAFLASITDIRAKFKEFLKIQNSPTHGHEESAF